MERQISRIEASPIGYRLAKGAFWSLAGAMISRGLALASSLLVARMLGREGYGQLGMIQSTVGMFGAFAGFGLGTTAMRYVAQYRTTDPAKAGRAMALAELFAAVSGGSMALVLVVLGPYLAMRTLAAPHLANLLKLGALLLFVNALNGAQTGALAGFEAFDAIATRSVWAGLTSFPLMVGGVYLAGVTGGVWALIASMSINWVLNFLALRREAAKASVPYTARGCMQEISILWQFSLPATLSNAMVGPVTWACNALLANQPTGYSELGIYSAASTFGSMLLLIGQTAGAPLLPMITNAEDSGDGHLPRMNMLSTWFLAVLLAVPLLSGFEVAQRLFGRQFAGPSFRHTFVLVIFYTCIAMYKQGLARVLVSQGLMWYSLLSNGFWGVIVLFCQWRLARYGACGLALALCIGYALNVVVFVPFYTRRRLAPSATIISVEVAAIWLILLLASVMAFFDVPALCRVAFGACGLTAAFLLFGRLMGLPLRRTSLHRPG